ncbi:MAG: hypothetical protein JO166_01050 [Deltaproteobacteria bacterium]|nr:hypothetical protein [Deltaproteobacteria bacterium]
MSASKPLRKCRNRRDDVETGTRSYPGRSPDGVLITVRAAAGMKAGYEHRLRPGVDFGLRHSYAMHFLELSAHRDNFGLWVVHGGQRHRPVPVHGQ